MRRRTLSLILVPLALVAAACAGAPGATTTLDRVAGAPATTSPATTSTTVSLPTSTDPPPEPEPAAPSTTEGPHAAAAAAPPPPAPVPAPPGPVPTGTVSPAALAPYVGLGAWVDVFDWTMRWTNDEPRVGIAEIDHMADEGVQTLYIQAARWDWDGADDVVERERLEPMLHRARARGMRVVPWYLPTFEDPAVDLRRLLAVATTLPADSVAVDIESRHVHDVDERNRRLIWLSAELRAALPGVALGGITLAPVHMETINPNYWPRFPWVEIRPYYDVWLPMSYQSERRASSGWRDGYRYTAENIDRLRSNLGDPEARVHTIGGIADRTPPSDVDGMVRAAVERRAVGGSIYDYDTTPSHLWPHLRQFRS